MSISLFTDAMGYDKTLTNFDKIKQMSADDFAQFMFDYGVDCCELTVNIIPQQQM